MVTDSHESYDQISNYDSVPYSRPKSMINFPLPASNNVSENTSSNNSQQTMQFIKVDNTKLSVTPKFIKTHGDGFDTVYTNTDNKSVVPRLNRTNSRLSVFDQERMKAG